MNERTFTKGQEVYLKIIEGSNVYRGLPKEANGKPDILKRLIPTTVTSVNKKYVTVDYKNTKFEVENDYREHSDYSSCPFVNALSFILFTSFKIIFYLLYHTT